MNKDTSGPAFPVTLSAGATYSGHEPFDGMSLRDYFAAKAMQAMVSTPAYETGGWAIDDIAEQSYDMADAMLEARSK